MTKRELQAALEAANLRLGAGSSVVGPAAAGAPAWMIGAAQTAGVLPSIPAPKPKRERIRDEGPRPWTFAGTKLSRANRPFHQFTTTNVNGGEFTVGVPADLVQALTTGTVKAS